MKHIKWFLFLLVFNMYSQNIELKWAEKINTRDKVHVLGGKDGKYYTRHRNNDQNLVCREYDKDLKLKNEKTVSFNLEEKKYGYINAYFVKDRIIHFIEENIRKEDKNLLYGGITDLSLKTTDKVFILDEADEKAYSFGLNDISPDSTKIVVYHEIKGKKKDPNTLNMKVYNTSFTEILLEKSAQLPIKSKNYNTESIKVDNLGNVYVLAKIFKEKDEIEKNQSKYYYKLIVFGKNEKPTEFDFDYPNKDIESIDIIPGDNNTLICTGFLKILDKGLFGKGKKTLISDEMFSSIIDCKTITLKSAKNYELEGLYPEKPKKDEDYTPYLVKNIFVNKDGSSVVVAEQYKLIVQTYTTQNGTRTSYLYYYCDIAIIHINNKSEVESVSKMPKYQLNAENPSILVTHVDGTTYIVYEDLEKNINAESDKDTKRSSKSMFSSSSKNALFLLSVDQTGEMKKEIIYSYKDSKIRPRILTSSVINKREIMLNADDQIGILRINK